MTAGDGAHARIGWRVAARWVVWALLLAGVFALHALASHDSVGVRHTSLVAPAVAVQFADAPQIVGDAAIIDAVSGDIAHMTPTVTADETETACIMFLAGGAWVLVLLMARTVKRHPGDPADGPSPPRQARRGLVLRPPGPLSAAGLMPLRL